MLCTRLASKDKTETSGKDEWTKAATLRAGFQPLYKDGHTVEGYTDRMSTGQ